MKVKFGSKNDHTFSVLDASDKTLANNTHNGLWVMFYSMIGHLQVWSDGTLVLTMDSYDILAAVKHKIYIINRSRKCISQTEVSQFRSELAGLYGDNTVELDDDRFLNQLAELTSVEFKRVFFNVACAADLLIADAEKGPVKMLDSCLQVIQSLQHAGVKLVIIYRHDQNNLLMGVIKNNELYPITANRLPAFAEALRSKQQNLTELITNYAYGYAPKLSYINSKWCGLEHYGLHIRVDKPLANITVTKLTTSKHKSKTNKHEKN